MYDVNDYIHFNISCMQLLQENIVQNIGITPVLLMSCHINNVELPYLGDVKAMHIAIGLLIPG